MQFRFRCYRTPNLTLTPAAPPPLFDHQDINPDAELIAACEAFLRSQRAFADACEAIEGDIDGDNPAWSLLDGQDELEEMIVALKAVTAEGVVARARCAAFFYLPINSACQDDPEAAREDRFQAACLRDLARMEYGA